jgi:hypothetical protein
VGFLGMAAKINTMAILSIDLLSILRPCRPSCDRIRLDL